MPDAAVLAKPADSVLGLQDLIAGGVWQEPRWQGEGGRAGVRAGSGQGLADPGAS